MKLTNRQGFCLMTCFLLGNVLSGIGSGNKIEKTGYLAVFLSFVPLIFMIFIYRMIQKKNQNRGLWESIRDLFGKTISKILFGIIGIFSFLSAFLSIANLTEFMEKSTYFQTPNYAVLVVSLLLILYLCLSREKAMGRYCEIVLPIVLAAVFILFLFGLKHFKAENLVFVSSAKHFIWQGFEIFAAPFSEITFVYLLFDRLQDKTKITKIAIGSCTLTIFLFSGMYLFNLLILGNTLMASVPFPTFYAASVVEVGTVIEKAETLITFSYTFCDLLYSSVCLFLCIKSAQHLFVNRKNAKKITAITAVIFLFVLLSIPSLSKNIRLNYGFITVGMIFFTIGLPLSLLTASLIKKTNTKDHSPQNCNTGDQK